MHSALQYMYTHTTDIHMCETNTLERASVGSYGASRDPLLWNGPASAGSYGAFCENKNLPCRIYPCVVLALWESSEHLLDHNGRVRATPGVAVASRRLSRPVPAQHGVAVVMLRRTALKNLQGYASAELSRRVRRVHICALRIFPKHIILRVHICVCVSVCECECECVCVWACVGVSAHTYVLNKP